jgi:hypothetical protein
MQTKIPVHNPGAMAMYVAGLMIPPGETRHFDEDLVPLHLRPAPVEPEPEAPVDALADLVTGTVKEVSAAVPGLSDEDLSRLGELEQAKGDAARKGVLSAIAEETLKRADAKTAADAAAAGAGAT